MESQSKTRVSGSKTRGPLFWMIVALASSCGALACFVLGVLRFAKSDGLFGVLAILLGVLLCISGIRCGLRSARDNKLQTGIRVVSVFARIAIALGLFQLLCGIVLGVYVGYLFAKGVQSSVTGQQDGIQCAGNLRQIQVAIAAYAGDNKDKAPPNWMAFTKYIDAPKILLCPGDGSRSVAENWASFRSENVSYIYLMSGSIGTNDKEQVKKPILLCPIHHHLLLGDGSVVSGAGGGIELSMATNWPARSDPKRLPSKGPKGN